MRLGLVGPVGFEPQRLRRVLQFLLDECDVDRVLYLGNDSALDSTLARWGEELIGSDPSDEALWSRAARSCAKASAEGIEEFLGKERALERLRRCEALPVNDARTVELLDGNLVVLIHDKAGLDEEDILPATFLVFGRSNAPLIKQVGQRWFLCPGPLDKSGAMVLEGGGQGVALKLYDADNKLKHSERLVTTSAAKLKVTQ